MPVESPRWKPCLQSALGEANAASPSRALFPTPQAMTAEPLQATWSPRASSSPMKYKEAPRSLRPTFEPSLINSANSFAEAKVLDTSPMAKVKVQDVPMPRRPPGYYEEVILKKYWRNCKVVDGKEICGEEVDCSNAIKDINPHELKRVDDNSERFELVFIMKMYWLDPLLHSFPTKLIRRRPEPQLKPFEPPLQEVEGIVRRKYKNGDLLFVEKEGDARYKKAVLIKKDDYEGGFVEYARRYDAVFQETLELRRFPMDRQLCRIKLTAEADIQTFQFVVLEGDYYFHNVLINIFLVNVIALFSFAVPVSDTGDRLSLLSTTLVAVTAYQTVINQSIPRKAYLTACDKYVIFAVIFQVLIGIETTIVAFIFQYHDWDEEMPARIRLIDSWDVNIRCQPNDCKCAW
eukprot:g25130.t1